MAMALNAAQQEKKFRRMCDVKNPWSNYPYENPYSAIASKASGKDSGVCINTERKKSYGDNTISLGAPSVMNYKL